MVTVFVGSEASPSEVEELENWIRETYPDIEFYMIDGGQDVYPFIFVVE